MDFSTPGFPVLQHLQEFAQTHFHESVMPSNHLILCHPLLLPSIFPSIKVFSNDLALCIQWPRYWSFSINLELIDRCKSHIFCLYKGSREQNIYNPDASLHFGVFLRAFPQPRGEMETDDLCSLPSVKTIFSKMQSEIILALKCICWQDHER